LPIEDQVTKVVLEVLLEGFGAPVLVIPLIATAALAHISTLLVIVEVDDLSILTQKLDTGVDGLAKVLVAL